MNTYLVKTLETWSTVVTYAVEAASEDEAKKQISSLEVDFIEHDHTGDDEILEFTSFELLQGGVN